MTRRYISSDFFPFRKDESGRPLCRYCGASVQSPRRSWCSQECVDEFLLRSSGSGFRSAVFRRDKGVCGCCGCDTEHLQRILDHAIESFRDLVSHEAGSWGWWEREVWRVLTGLGFNEKQSLWEADHIVEVVHDGETSLDNAQTLCVPCHKAKTRKMHEDRARARCGQEPLPEPAEQATLRF